MKNRVIVPTSRQGIYSLLARLLALLGLWYVQPQLIPVQNLRRHHNEYHFRIK